MRSVFGDYELLSEIARGGMGVVYRARQISLNRPVALKLILTGQFAGDAEVKRFRAEAEAVANLEHPNIVALYEVGECEGQHFYSMKLIEGRSLAERPFATSKNLEDITRLMLKVVLAIHHAHHRGVLHRDLKPANILVDAQGEPYVTDFGLARRLGVEGRLTGTGTIFGTPAYMPPEQADDARKLTVSADIYSLGAILYDLLTGRPPFEASTPIETVLMVRNEEPTRPRLLRPEIARDLETICLKCLQKDPSKRYPSARALAEDLERYLVGEPILARQSGLAERAWRWARRHPAVSSLSVTVALLMLVAAIGTGVFANRLSREVKTTAQANQSAQNELWATYLSQARAERGGIEVGRKEDGLEAVTAAAAIRSNSALVDEAVAQFGLLDFSRKSIRRLQEARNLPVVFTPDFDSYLLAGTNRTLTVHRTSDDAELWRWQSAPPEVPTNSVSRAMVVDRETSRIERILVAPLGAMAAINFSDQRLELLDLVSHRPVTNFSGLEGVAFSPDGRHLLVVDDKQRPRLVEAATGNPLTEPPLPSHKPEEMVFGPDPAVPMLALATYGSVELWDRKLGKVSSRLEHGHEINCLAWEGDLLAVGDTAGDIRIWNLRTARTLLLKAHRDFVIDLLFTPGARQLISNGQDGRTFCWDPQTGDRLLTSERFHTLQISRDGSRLAYGDEENWGWTKTLFPQGLRRINCPDVQQRRIREVHFSPDGRLLLIVRQTGLHFFEVSSGRRILFQPFFPATGAWFLPDGHTLLVHDHDTVFWFEVETKDGVMALREQRRLVLPGTKWLEPGSLSADGTVLSLCTGAGPVVLLDAATGHQIQRIEAKEASVGAYSPASRWIAARGREDDRLMAWNLSQPDKVLELNLPEASAAMSPDGRWLLGSSATRHQVVELKPGGKAQTFPGGGNMFRHSAAAAWSPDGQVLAAATGRGEIELRCTGTWQHILNLISPQPANISDLVFSPDQRYLAVATSEEQVELWDFSEIRTNLALLHLTLPEPKACLLPRGSTAPSTPFVAQASAISLPRTDQHTYPPRPALATAHQIDLSAYYNQRLDEASLGALDPGTSASSNGGLQSLGGSTFDVRGAVQLQSSGLVKYHPEYPLSIPAIPVNIRAQRIHFLGALAGLYRLFPYGTPIGRCVVKFEDGRQTEFPWRAWQEFDNEWFNPRSAREHTDSKVVWRGMDADAEASNNRVRLMMATWQNPWPETKITSLELRSDNQSPAPIIVAITAE